MNTSTEWLQTNRLGSFATGSADRIPRRKYHSHLTLREPGVGDALNSLGEVGESISRGENVFLLHNLNYGDVVHPHGYQYLASFSHDPLPTWKYVLGDIQVERTLELDPDQDTVRIGYRVKGITDPVLFRIEPLLTCRPIHHVAQENPFLDGTVQTEKTGVSIQPYPSLPRFYMSVSGKPATFVQAGRWDKRVFYSLEQERGYEAREDYFCPGAFEIRLVRDGEFTFHFGEIDSKNVKIPKPIQSQFSTPTFKKSAAQFLIATRKNSHAIIAGYPWFEAWDRDTMISLPGLCLTTGNLKFAKMILQEYAAQTTQQLIPGAPVVAGQSQNIMVDAPLLFIRAVQLTNGLLSAKESKVFMASVMPSVLVFLNGLKQGIDPRIEITTDGLLFVKPGNYASTWMDVVIDGTPLTPRNGFAVDLNALYYNALCFSLEWARDHGKEMAKEWEPIRAKAEEAFLQRFWSEKLGYLADCHDGTAADFSLRPNQLWATALPYSPVPMKAARSLLKIVQNELLTPVGLRTLAPSDPRYRPVYRGTQRQRDLVYHQGTVWPWLLGIYADSLLKILGKKATQLQMAPILERLENHFLAEGCLSHISEVFDAAEPHLPNGTPAQAWSLGETIRVAAMVDWKSKKTSKKTSTKSGPKK